MPRHGSCIPGLMTFLPALSIVFVALASSVHCAAMCGPLCRTFGFAAAGSSRGDTAGYHLGRVFGYATLGAGAALLGRSAVSSVLSPFSLVFTVLMVGLTFRKAWTFARPPSPSAGSRDRGQPPVAAWGAHVRSRALRVHARLLGALRLALKRARLPAPFAAGLATALLPCGFLFAALGYAAVTLDPAAGAATMAVFALATTPAVLAGARFSDWLGRSVARPRDAARKRYLAAGFLVLAGLTLASTLRTNENEPACRSVQPVDFAARGDTLPREGTFRPMLEIAPSRAFALPALPPGTVRADAARQWGAPPDVDSLAFVSLASTTSSNLEL